MRVSSITFSMIPNSKPMFHAAIDKMFDLRGKEWRSVVWYFGIFSFELLFVKE